MSAHRSPTGRHRRSHRRPAALARYLVAGLAVLGAVVLAVPGARGAYVAKVTNSTNTATAATYFTCAAAAQGETGTRAYFAYPFSDTNLLGVLPVTDVSGNNNSGAYSATGITTSANTGADKVCDRDGRSVITLNGTTGYVSGPSSLLAAPGPAVFTEEIWFRTSTAQGKLIGYGNVRSGASGQFDRHLYIDASGYLQFGVYPNVVKTIASPSKVTDGIWHYAAASLSGAGMILYLDGKQVAIDSTTTTAENHSGYWRIGYDSITNWTNSPASGFFKGDLAFASVYNYALTPAQVAAHFVAGS